MITPPAGPRRDLVGGLGFLLLALVGVEESLRLPLGTWQRPAPGLFPLLVSLVLAGMAVALLFAAGEAHATAPPGASPAARPKVWWTVVSLLAFWALLERLGFLSTSFLLLVFLLRGIAGQRWRLALATGAGASLASSLVFDRLLGLPLPRGPIGF